jgi:hypothetical protein
MINRFITWLRRDDDRLEPLRREIQQKEKPMDWEKIQILIIYILAAVSLVGLAFMFTIFLTSV